MNMTLTEATALAETIHADERFVVIAIGRFLLLEELVAPGGPERPWGLTVLPRDKPERRVTLWSPEQWTEYRTLVLEEMALAVDANIALHQQMVKEAIQEAVSTPHIVKASPTENQLLLF